MPRPGACTLRLAPGSLALPAAPEQLLLHMPLTRPLRRRLHDSLIAILAFFVNGTFLEFADLIINDYNEDIDCKSDIDAHASRPHIADRPPTAIASVACSSVRSLERDSRMITRPAGDRRSACDLRTEDRSCSGGAQLTGLVLAAHRPNARKHAPIKEFKLDQERRIDTKHDDSQTGDRSMRGPKRPGDRDCTIGWPDRT